ncbi:hypothetical protein DSO57_1031410 [Entomophthora muscae]|uniref:Uncharacterized protein n=1 Tax=Entomophthora muscae TaxID=34485 RepID=A0ACC2RRQ6_9FUNG|nr:hypothetical protein DSO57_1031410 [Entomophthora muscae]
MPPELFNCTTNSGQKTGSCWWSLAELTVGVRNIPDNTLCQDKLLCAIELKEQNKILQQFPLIGETATKRQAKESKIKKCNFGGNGFIPQLWTARPAASCPQAARQPASQRGDSAPSRRDCLPLPNGEIVSLGTPKRQFPQTPKEGELLPKIERD